MGSFINAYCTTCEFRQQGIMFGGGFGGKPPLVPAIRKDNGEFVISDQLDDAGLTFYHDASMYQGEITGHGIQHHDIMLNPKNNLCPACGNYTLQFEDIGNWD